MLLRLYTCIVHIYDDDDDDNVIKESYNDNDDDGNDDYRNHASCFPFQELAYSN